MPTSIFTPCEGAVVRLKLCEGAAAGSSGTFNVKIGGTSLGVPVTGFIHEMQGNYQFLHALDNFIYYYNFGDRVGELTVSGIAFTGPVCGPGSGGDGSICSLYSLYNQKKQSKLKKAVEINIDRCGAVKAFLTGMRLEVSSSSGNGVPIGQWSMRFHVIPPRDI